uniref:Uncharacterized protein TCIL3000_11_8390 n=1 Tax=Trypanosoma congolense (strain IL3000) TaxID=1068625 RepID=G0V164_TRYCI|nr:unnamed protein product [Trypanosoma congolense IL3000]
MNKVGGEKSAQGAVGAPPVTRKRIRFVQDRNVVHHVKPPPRSMNSQFWFSEKAATVLRGLTLEVCPGEGMFVVVETEMHLTSITLSPAEPKCPGNGGLSNENKPHGGNKSGRSFLQIKEENTFLRQATCGKWMCLGSVAGGTAEKLHVRLPAGSYVLRCVGTRSIQVFAQLLDLTSKLG